ncbi:50S ribosomal protein L29 [Candidatus Woesearchaeota archaeon]|nr:50S ribosomal protein L29 [Candidatus Woesearchaeota archaeon]
MKIKDLKSLPEDELNSKKVELLNELIKERAQAATGTVSKTPSKIRLAKRTIARINTILADKEVKKKA